MRVSATFACTNVNPGYMSRGERSIALEPETRPGRLLHNVSRGSRNLFWRVLHLDVFQATVGIHRVIVDI